MNKVKAVFISFFSALSSLLGVLYIPVLLLVLCNVLDYFTGLFAAPARGQKISSAIGIRGIIKKVCMWLLVVVGVIVDELLRYSVEFVGLTMPLTFLVACIVCVWLVCNEIISILENMDDIGIKLPPFLKKIVLYLKNKAEQKADIVPKEGEENGED
ncbi:MAG: phage holin family protein [Lachnospiraceae bacterium]|nr:phage holin family protein [Lachnospiraceae bacterium]